MRHLIAASGLVAVVLAACSEGGSWADCQTVRPKLVEFIQRSTASTVGAVYAVPSRTHDDVWFVAAQTDRGVAVWGTEQSPSGEGIAYVLNANRAAMDDSVIGLGIESEGDLDVAKALKDEEGIAAAEACLAGSEAAPSG